VPVVSVPRTNTVFFFNFNHIFYAQFHHIRIGRYLAVLVALWTLSASHELQLIQLTTLSQLHMFLCYFRRAFCSLPTLPSKSLTCFFLLSTKILSSSSGFLLHYALRFSFESLILWSSSTQTTLFQVCFPGKARTWIPSLSTSRQVPKEKPGSFPVERGSDSRRYLFVCRFVSCVVFAPPGCSLVGFRFYRNSYSIVRRMQVDSRHNLDILHRLPLPISCSIKNAVSCTIDTLSLLV
jgi:hypothetical protein